MSRLTRRQKLPGQQTPADDVQPPVVSEKEELLPAAVIRVDDTGISLDIWERTKPARINWDIVDETLVAHGVAVGQAVTVLVNKVKTGRPQVSWVQSWGQGTA